MTCSIIGCNNTKYAKGYCRRHYNQQYYCGGILSRTWLDPNECIIEGDTTRIFLYNRKQEKVAETIIDTEDLERCKPIKWHLRDGYVIGPIPLAWFLKGKKKYEKCIVDHIDANPLNNKKSNLQLITIQQNQYKKSMQRNNTSGYRGVYYLKGNKKWKASVNYNYKQYYVGEYNTPEEAALAYNKKANELYGEFAKLNKLHRRT